MVQACASYLIGPLVFTGTRKMFSNRVCGATRVPGADRSQIETERLKVLSCPLPKPTTSDKKADDGRPILVPPAYSVDVQYTRSSNGGKSILARKADKLVLGNLGTCSFALGIPLTRQANGSPKTACSWRLSSGSGSSRPCKSPLVNRYGHSSTLP